MSFKAASLLFFLFSFFMSCSNQKKEITIIQEIYPQIGNLSIKVLATGSIVPLHRIELKAADKGRAEKVFFNEGDYIKENTLLALISTMDRISLIDSAKANLIQAESSKNQSLIDIAKQELKTAQSAYNPVPIISPVSGEIIKRDVLVGEYVTPDKALFVLSDRLVLKLDVNEADIGKINSNHQASFYLDAYPDEIYSAKVKQISREAKNVSNIMKYELLAYPEKVQRKWIAGMTVNAEFITSSKQNVLLLPMDAIKKFKNKSFVIIQNQQEKTIKEIKTGTDDFKNIEILEGIDKNDKVLVVNQKDFMELMKPVQKSFIGKKGFGF